MIYMSYMTNSLEISLFFLVLYGFSQNSFKCTYLQRYRSHCRTRDGLLGEYLDSFEILFFFFFLRGGTLIICLICFVVYLKVFKEASEGFWRTWKNMRTRLWMAFLVYKERKRELHLLWLTSLLQTWPNINAGPCVLHSCHYPHMAHIELFAFLLTFPVFT